MALKCYGENSATFLIFKALSDSETGIRDLLLSLMQAGTGNRIAPALVPDEKPVVWLFPNFGKRHGFGEPDALILIGGHSFWFEVETRVNLNIRRDAAKQSLRQLARFHLLQKAVQGGAHVHLAGRPHLAIGGPTVSNSGRIKYGMLRLQGHRVLQHHANQIAHTTPHYVIMSVRKAKGNGEFGFGLDLGHLATETFASIQQSLEAWKVEQAYQPELPDPLRVESIWYTYWRGHALDRCYPDGPDPLVKGGWA